MISEFMSGVCGVSVEGCVCVCVSVCVEGCVCGGGVCVCDVWVRRMWWRGEIKGR